jgi:hypothetical protein
MANCKWEPHTTVTGQVYCIRCGKGKLSHKFPRKAKARIIVNRHIVQKNAKGASPLEPPLAVHRRGKVERGSTIRINGPSLLVYRPEKPLPCGARVWIEADADSVEILPAKLPVHERDGIKFVRLGEWPDSDPLKGEFIKWMRGQTCPVWFGCASPGLSENSESGSGENAEGVLDAVYEWDYAAFMDWKEKKAGEPLWD